MSESCPLSFSYKIKLMSSKLANGRLNFPNIQTTVILTYHVN